MLSLATASLALAATEPAWAHPPEEHAGAATAAEAVAAPEQIPEAEVDASHHDLVAPHDHDAASAHQPGSVTPAAGHHDEAVPHEHGAEAAEDHHDEALPHEHGGEGEEGHHGGAGHSHWGDNGANTPLEKSIESLGVYHPLLVHFPIALILAAALAQALNLAGVRVTNADTVRFLVWTGALGGLAAGLLGWAHAGPMASDEAGIMLAHRWIGSSLAVGLFGVVAAVEWHRKSASGLSGFVMNLSLFAAAAAVAINGFLGGSLAHGGMNHLMGMGS
tara:strand:+ start:21897 stop:22724 length:828 start_codon:yes stop_codon:yes gene_type:complete